MSYDDVEPLTEEQIEEALSIQEKVDSLLSCAEIGICVACNGSGYYDNNGSPRCGSCNGLGQDLSYKQTEEIYQLKRAMYTIDDEEGDLLSDRIAKTFEELLLRS